jgi:adenylosuccinate synthase
MSEQTNQINSKVNCRGYVDVVLGAQLGDEGKGRFIDMLSSSSITDNTGNTGDNKYKVVARCNSGGNAGHKVVVAGIPYAFHLVPSGILNKNVIGIIGNGCVVNLDDLKKEIEGLTGVPNIRDRLYISDRAHIVLPLHKEADGIREVMKSKDGKMIGTTKQGMGPVYATKALRVGLRMCDLFLSRSDLANKIKLLLDELSILPGMIVPSCDEIITYLEGHVQYYIPMIIDTITYCNDMLSQGYNILVEGAQAALLDIDFGVYPYCTSTTCTISAVIQGLGIPPYYIRKIYYIMKTYCTRVGNGPFPTEQCNKQGEIMQEVGHEYGTTTGRRRRCGWLDIPMVKWSLLVNGVQNAVICITKLDVFDGFDEIQIGVEYEGHVGFPALLEDLARVKVKYETFPGWKCNTQGIRKYEDLPIEAKNYLKRIEELLGVEIEYIGVGADRDAVIEKKH